MQVLLLLSVLLLPDVLVSVVVELVLNGSLLISFFLLELIDVLGEAWVLSALDCIVVTLTRWS